MISTVLSQATQIPGSLLIEFHDFFVSQQHYSGFMAFPFGKCCDAEEWWGGKGEREMKVENSGLFRPGVQARLNG